MLAVVKLESANDPNPPERKWESGDVSEVFVCEDEVIFIVGDKTVHIPRAFVRYVWMLKRPGGN